VKLKMKQTVNRNPIDVLRVRYWYEGMKQQTGCTTAYQLEHLLEPLHTASSDARTLFRNKWIRYESGKHTPRSSLLNRIEKRVKNADRELNHPIWDVLRLGKTCAPQIDDWLKKLDPRVQLTVCGKQIDGAFAPTRQVAFNKNQGLRLVKLGTLDALTALLLLWIEAQYNNQAANMRVHAD
jgi:hypothetical protein